MQVVLKELIYSCWHHRADERPAFVEVKATLKRLRKMHRDEQVDPEADPTSCKANPAGLADVDEVEEGEDLSRSRAASLVEDVSRSRAASLSESLEPEPEPQLSGAE